MKAPDLLVKDAEVTMDSVGICVQLLGGEAMGKGPWLDHSVMVD